MIIYYSDRGNILRVLISNYDKLSHTGLNNCSTTKPTLNKRKSDEVELNEFAKCAVLIKTHKYLA